MAITPPFSPATTNEERSVSPPRKRAVSQATSNPIEIETPRPQEDPVDRQQHASTPLLPPMMAEYFSDSAEGLQSPLQSPTVANSAAASTANTPAGTPVLPGFPTPPLSAKASFASLRNARSGQVPQSTSEIPPLTIAEEREDPWANKLGHANFHITPEPYLPEVCDAQNCKRLADDWERARVEYMRQAARISEHYGITSQTYKLTEQKWAEIDAEWRANHELANAQAQASGESPFFQPLAETQPLSKMPSLNDPKQPSKFPSIEEKDIVGPMVRYAKIQHEQKPAKKANFLKLFTDPASLLGGRSNMNVRR